MPRKFASVPIFQLISPDPTSPCQRCSASPEKSPDLRLVFLPRQTVDRAGHRLLRHPEILPLRGRFFAPVRIPAAKVSRIRTIQKALAFYTGECLLLPFLYKSLLAATVRRDFSFWSSSSETEKGNPFPFSLLPKYPA